MPHTKQLLQPGRMHLRDATALQFCQFNSSVQDKATATEPAVMKISLKVKEPEDKDFQYKSLAVWGSD